MSGGAFVVSAGAVSALGVGDEAFSVGREGDRPRVAICPDVRLREAGLLRPVSARVTGLELRASDLATDLLGFALRRCVAGLDPAWLNKRVGLAIGTSSGGMLTSERFFSALARKEQLLPSFARGATYFAPLEQATADLRIAFAPRVMVLGACASSTLAVGLALRWLELGRCDIALAGGYDALSLFVASGFEALRATTAALPRPFRVGRDGMALGEGAAVVALSRSSEAGRPLGYMAGFGASTDAVHLTAPDPTGQGLARAATLALADAGVSAGAIDLVGAHATATPFNDPAEVKALRLALGSVAPKVVHPFKAQIGHTLGAAGVLESLALLDAMNRDIAPAAAGGGELDPECAVPLLEKNGRLQTGAALKLSSAFGGTNAALVLTTGATGTSPRPRRDVFLVAFTTLSEPFDNDVLAARHPHVHRLDHMSKLVISAVHALALRADIATLRGAGLVLGHTLATLEHNAVFDARRRERGARFVEPRRFPATSPNAASGECAIAFQLTGPTFAVGASLHGGLEALAVARDLVAVGDAATMLVVAADLAGATSSALLSAAGAPPLAEGACVALLSCYSARALGPACDGCQPGSGGAGLPNELPPTLASGRDWAWAAPYGHCELESYLRGLG